MGWTDTRCGAGALLWHYRRLAGTGAEPWFVQRVPVCASTEPLLSRWLDGVPGVDRRFALLAGHQTRSTGQRGRIWLSPAGGLWISTAMPAYRPAAVTPELLGLAVAVVMAQRLEPLGLPVRIKWPNDLMVEGRKLAGLLPRLVHRGSTVRLVRIGFGLNVANAVPPEGTSLRRLLGSGHRSVDYWGAQLLHGLDQCLTHGSGLGWCIPEAERRLWDEQVRDPFGPRVWQIEGLASDGALRLRHGTHTCRWTRWADSS